MRVMENLDLTVVEDLAAGCLRGGLHQPRWSYVDSHQARHYRIQVPVHSLPQHSIDLHAGAVPAEEEQSPTS